MPRATQVSPAQLVSPAHSDDLSAAGTVFPSDSQAVGLALPCLLPALGYDLPQLCSLFLVSHLSEKVTGSRSLTSTLMLASRFTPLSTQGTQEYEPGWGQECVGVSSSQIGLSQQETQGTSQEAGTEGGHVRWRDPGVQRDMVCTCCSHTPLWSVEPGSGAEVRKEVGVLASFIPSRLQGWTELRRGEEGLCLRAEETGG